jgi:O-acetyl-ADP-ribose deacetylase (regulator of RNase III)
MCCTYISGGDITKPIDNGKNICIAHCVNDIRVMGAGVAKALYTKWPNVRSEYLKLTETQLALGNIQVVNVEDNIVVVNLFGQHGVGPDIHDNPPIRYTALAGGFMKIRHYCQSHNADLHIPYKLGCDLAGGDWNIVEDIIHDDVLNFDINVFVYDKFFQRK